MLLHYAPQKNCSKISKMYFGYVVYTMIDALIIIITKAYPKAQSLLHSRWPQATFAYSIKTHMLQHL